MGVQPREIRFCVLAPRSGGFPASPPNSRVLQHMERNNMSDTEEYISQQQLQEADEALASQDEDTRWQAATTLGAFSETDPEAIWPLTVKYGSCANEDTRVAVATCVLEHILEYHFGAYFGRVQHLMQQGDSAFADTYIRCWQFGQAKVPGNSEKFKSLTRQAERLWQSRRRKRKLRARSPEQKSKQEWRQARNKITYRSRFDAG